MPHQVFKTTNPIECTGTLGSPIVSIVVPPTGQRDFLFEIEVGMKLTTAGVFSTLSEVVTAINTTTREVTFSGNAVVGTGTSWGYFSSPTGFTVPEGVYVMYKTSVGGGQGGAGGEATGAGGGGGGGAASATFEELELFVTPGTLLTCTPGVGGKGGVAGAQPLNYHSSGSWQARSIVDSELLSPDYATSDFQRIPNARPELSLLGRPTAGTLSNGGAGGYAAPPIAANTPSGNAGGAGGAASSNASPGLPSSYRGRYGRMGGSGGGGAGPSVSIPGEGGSDMVETNNWIGGVAPATSHAKAGGSGGSSAFGKGGLSGHPDNPSAGIGETGRGYGSGGGGGYAGYAGGDGAPGIIILKW